MEYDNTNRGTLYRNENTKKDGKKFFSLSVKQKEKQNPYAKPKQEPEKFIDDDIPFN